MSHADVLAALSAATGQCRAGGDGDCTWAECPQLRDNEPEATGRDCPLWVKDDDDY